MTDDPRNTLAPGVYRARIVERMPEAIHYTIEGCGDWRYRMTEHGVGQPFWARIQEVDSFNIEVMTDGRQASAVDWGSAFS